MKNEHCLSAKKGLLEARIAAAALVVLGFVSIAETFDYLIFYGYTSSLLGAEIIGFLYPLALFAIAYFDLKQKAWAFALTILLAGLSLFNTILGLREATLVTVQIVDSVLLGCTVVAALASLLAFAKMSYSS